MKKFAEYIAIRYLRGHGRFILSFSNVLSLVGICLGVFSLLTVISVMNGFDSDIRQRITSFRSDVKISHTGGEPLKDYQELVKKIDQYDYIKNATPIISNELLIQSKDGIYGGVCLGVDFDSYASGTNLKERIVIGHPDAESLNDNGIILGFDLAMNLNVSVRDYVQLSSPLGSEMTPIGLLPLSRRFKVVGLFNSGIPDYDLNFCYYSLGSGQYFNGSKDEVDLLEVRTENADRAWYYRRLLSSELGNEYKVEDWSDYEANLFNAIKMEKVLMILVLSLIIILAGFNMAGNLNRLVTEKKRDIGILQAFGVGDKIIRQIFMSSSFYIGVSGIIIGIVLSYAFLRSQLEWEFIKIPVSGFPIQVLPVDIRLSDFIIIPLLALLITLLSALVPASRSQEVSTIEIIRNRG